MAIIGAESPKGDICKHGFPKEFGECPECVKEMGDKPLVETRGQGYKINITDAEIDELVERLGVPKEAVSQEMAEAREKLEKQEPTPVAAEPTKEVIAEPEPSTEKKLNRLERESKDAAQRFFEIYSQRISGPEKQSRAQETIRDYQKMFKNPKAKSIGMVYLNNEISRQLDDMTESTDDQGRPIMSETRFRNFVAEMPLIGLRYLEKKDDQNDKKTG
jgi:hypothetical protein